MTQNFSRLKAMPPRSVCGGGWGNALKISIITPKKKKERKKERKRERKEQKDNKYLFGAASVPIPSLGQSGNRTAAVLGRAPERRRHSRSSQASERLLGKYLKVGRVKAKENKGDMKIPV